MTSQDFLNKKIEEVYDFLEKNAENFLNLSSLNTDNIKVTGDLFEIKAEGPVYIVPNELSFSCFTSIGDSQYSLDKKLNENENAIVILNTHPGKEIFSEVVSLDSFVNSNILYGLNILKEYYDFLKKYPGRVISLGGESKIKAIDWFRKVLKTKDKNLEDLIQEYLIREEIEEISNGNLKDFLDRLDYYSELNRFGKAIKDSKETNTALFKIRLYFTTLPSAAYIDFGSHGKILDIPGELPPLVLEKKIRRQDIREKDIVESLEEIIENTKPLKLDHIRNAKHGSILDRRISYGKNISARDLYIIEKIYKKLFELPVDPEVIKKLFDEKLRFEKEIYKYLLFTPEILKINSLDHIIAGSPSIKSPISINDPAKGLSLHHKNGLYFIEIDPDLLERENSIKIYDLHRSRIKLLSLDNQNKTVSSIIDEIEKKHKGAYEFFTYLSENILSKELIEKGYLGLLILDEALKYLPKAILKDNRRKGDFSTYII